MAKTAAGHSSKGQGGMVMGRRLQAITKNEFSQIFGPAAMHAVGHIAANLSFAAVAISLTHTVKTLEPAFNVALSKIFLGVGTPLPVVSTLIPIMVRAPSFHPLLAFKTGNDCPAILPSYWSMECLYLWLEEPAEDEAVSMLGRLHNHDNIGAPKSRLIAVSEG
jgi:hypothetical protein